MASMWDDPISRQGLLLGYHENKITPFFFSAPEGKLTNASAIVSNSRQDMLLMNVFSRRHEDTYEAFFFLNHELLNLL